ncbi:hypothetical protein L9F63_021962 [Diploptera punctata]|uniref:Tetratricopeptide repeat protein 27 n=1 Tax=Diploptera punctata TaxID=6984 RepID=A0AAD8EAU5_DIPPU|nr:hypothetical protein L9F63_021962 [Diploptera punctata]
MEQIQKFEEMLLLMKNRSTCDEAVDCFDDIVCGKFLNVVESAKCEEIFTRYLDNSDTTTVDELLENSVRTYLEKQCTAIEKQFEVLCMGVTCLHAFIQSNWTGPELKTVTLPWLQSHCTTQDVVDRLVLDGEACNHNMKHPELLLLARIAIKESCNTAQPLTVSALGLRTKFQVKELPQLTVKVSVSENRPVDFPTVQLEHLPKDLKLDDEVRLDKIKFSDNSAGEFPMMHPIEQAVMLGIFHQTLTSQPKDDLSNEELLPYLTCILSQPVCWSLEMSALFQRSRLEKDSSRSVERAMMQTEELVHSSAREAPDVLLRHYMFFMSYLPPRWSVEAQHADQLVSLGIVKTALEVYLRLQMWDKVIMCYNVLNMRHKASEVILQELKKKETVRLWCLLGDATDDTSCYEKAWELSEFKSGQAQRHWGLFYFNKKKYAESIPHLQQSLSINSLQVSLWFRLGFAALDQENWSLCASAYQRYCSLDPESFEAWNNLSKAYVKLNQKQRAWKTLQEALKWNYENWKLWDNYMIVSVDVGQLYEAMKAYNRILDLKPKHVDEEVLRILVEEISHRYKDLQLVQTAEKLFLRLTQEVRNNSSVWELRAKLLLNDEANKKSLESLEYILNSVQKGFWISIQDSRFERDVNKCLHNMECTVKFVEYVFTYCNECPDPQKSFRMLASLKLSLQTQVARVKKFYAHLLENGDHSKLATLLETLESNLKEVIIRMELERDTT